MVARGDFTNNTVWTKPWGTGMLGPMNIPHCFRRYATPGVILTAISLAAALLALSAFWFFFLSTSPQNPAEAPEAALTLLPGPSSTPPDPTSTPIPTSTVTATFSPLQPGEMGVGSYVQIVGTEGDGLNIRSAPGLASGVQFLGYDAEVFEVRDGPREVDGFTWWYLVTPVDEARAGWAAATYLSLVANP